MLRELILHQTTKRLVDAYMQSPSQGLLLIGKSGAGLGTLARAIAEELVTHKTDIISIGPDEKGTIPIERVRSLYVDTRDARTTKQVVIIDDIDAMSHDAQNAFLKLLEEPNDQIHFVLTSHAPESLLQTTLSRVQLVEVLPIDTVESQSFLRSGHVSDPTQLQQMLFIASGYPAELARLAGDTDYFSGRAQTVRLARDFLSGRPYQRLVIAGQISNRAEARRFVETLAQLVQVLGKKDAGSVSSRTVEALETAAERLAGNGNVRTQLANLALRV